MITEIIRISGLNVHVRGVSDSGWFLDREPFLPGAVAASEVTRQGWKLWSGVLPEACTLEQREPWRCYFGHRLYNTLKCKKTNEIKRTFIN
jgi:hypothetical protein